jgi:hypothetical protein
MGKGSIYAHMAAVVIIEEKGHCPLDNENGRLYI